MEETKFRKQNKKLDTMSLRGEFDQLTRKYNLNSLSGGVPHMNPPKFVVDNLLEAINQGKNQYTSSYGHPDARKYIAEYYQDKFEHQIDPNTEVLVSNGALTTLNIFFEAFIANEEDEVILIEPFFAFYSPLVLNAKGTIKTVPMVLEDSKYRLDLDVLKETLNSKTRLIVLNTPHNPTGKVFTLEELEQISDILEEYPHVYVLSDEVYFFLTFDQRPHHFFANIKDNWKKTVTLYSGSKVM